MAGTRRGSPREGCLEACENIFNLHEVLFRFIAVLNYNLGSCDVGRTGEGIVRLCRVTKSVILVTRFSA